MIRKLSVFDRLNTISSIAWTGQGWASTGRVFCHDVVGVIFACTDFSPSTSNMRFIMTLSLSTGTAHFPLTVPYRTPSTMPVVEGPNDFQGHLLGPVLPWSPLQRQSTWHQTSAPALSLPLLLHRHHSDAGTPIHAAFLISYPPLTKPLLPLCCICPVDIAHTAHTQKDEAQFAKILAEPLKPLQVQVEIADWNVFIGITPVNLDHFTASFIQSNESCISKTLMPFFNSNYLPPQVLLQLGRQISPIRHWWYSLTVINCIQRCITKRAKLEAVTRP